MQSTVPRRGSMQVWPRVRAKRIYPSIDMSKLAKGSLPQGLFGFAAYKVGMTHLIAVDTRKHTITKGEEISIPVTVLECPPIKMIGVRVYRQASYGIEPAREILTAHDKYASRILPARKIATQDISSLSDTEYMRISALIMTQPHLTGLGKKTPDIFEVPLGGSVDEKKAFVSEHFGKEIPLATVFKEGDYVDTHAVSKGKGFQGPVRRFGISLRQHKSEKTKRGPGSLGSWSGHAHFMYRIAHAGQMGYHTRTEYNKQLLKASTQPDEINVAGGFVHYGKVKGAFLLLKGGVIGPSKRLVLLTKPIRKTPGAPLPSILTINKDSKQG
jgi:large subunit ribosomal protein L3